MADVITSNTHLGPTKAQIIAAMVQRELVAQAVLAATVRDVSVFAKPGAKSVDFPKAGSFNVGERASGVAGEAQATNFTMDNLPFDIPAYISWIIDSNDAHQSSVEVQAEYVKRAVSAHSRYFDNKIAAKILGVFGQTVAHAVGTLDDKILKAREVVKTKGGIIQQMTLLVSPDVETDLLKVDKYVRYDALGTSNIPNGVVGKVYGMQVVVKDDLAAASAFVYDKDAVCFGIQRGAAYDEQKAIQYGTGSMLCAIDQLYGVAGQQIAVNGAAAGKTPLAARILFS